MKEKGSPLDSFHLYRDGKETLEGVLWDDKTVTVRWIERPSTAHFDSWEAFRNVHIEHHDYLTNVRWWDGEEEVFINGLNLRNVHKYHDCATDWCVIHRPSDHHMRHMPLLWRLDRMFFERICEHGVGHPDPDQITYWYAVLDESEAEAQSIHGCDGCCA